MEEEDTEDNSLVDTRVEEVTEDNKVEEEDTVEVSIPFEHRLKTRVFSFFAARSENKKRKLQIGDAACCDYLWL